MTQKFAVVTHTGSLVAVDPATGKLHAVPGFMRADERPQLYCDASHNFYYEFDGKLKKIRDLSAVLPEGQTDFSPVGLRRKKHFASAHPDGGLLEIDREVMDEWEKFILLDVQYIESIKTFSEKKWFSVDMNEIIILSELFSRGYFHLGNAKFAILENLEAILNAPTHGGSVILSRNTHLISRLIAWRPLVYYVCYGDDSQFSLLEASLHSLNAVGDYDAEICVITDRDDISAFTPLPLAGRIHILNLDAQHKEEFYRARYEIDRLPGIEQFGPILYVDTDICFIDHADIVLKRIALSDRICVGSEEYPHGVAHPPSLLAISPAAGSDFFKEDGFDPGCQFGFNSGILGFSGINIVRDPFRRVAQVVAIGLAEGRWVSFCDQAAANYLFYKLGVIDSQAISGFIQVGTHIMRYSYKYPAETPVLVHYWATPGVLRERVIREMTAARLDQRNIRSAGSLPVFIPAHPN